MGEHHQDRKRYEKMDRQHQKWKQGKWHEIANDTKLKNQQQS